MAEISLFNQYHGKENTITNYCGLMIKLLYQSSPANFEKFVVGLIDEETNISVEPQFHQQEGLSKKDKASIADLRIRQLEFELIFEVKRFDWFSEDQFERYIENLSNSDIKSNKILFALTEEFKDWAKFKELKLRAKKEGIQLQLITFSQLLEGLNEHKVNDEYYLRFLEEFEEFLENQNLLQSWQYLLDVVNCASSIDEVKKGSYFCPDKGGSYRHARAKYFAPYKDKKVESIFEIDAVLVLDFDGKEIFVDKMKFKNSKESDDDLKKRALKAINESSDRIKEVKKHPMQVFLLSNEEKTNFAKESPRGLFGSKKYFRGIAKDCSNSKELAEFLKGKTWEEFSE